MKKHEPIKTLYNERHPLRLVAEYILAAALFAYPMHLISNALNCNLSIRISDHSNLAQIVQAGN